MSDEPEHTQDHGTRAAVTAQRDKWRAYSQGLEGLIAQVCRSAEVYDRVIAYQRMVAEISDDDLEGKL